MATITLKSQDGGTKTHRISTRDMRAMKLDAIHLGQSYGRKRWSWLCLCTIVVRIPPEKAVVLQTVESPDAILAARQSGDLIEELTPSAGVSTRGL